MFQSFNVEAIITTHFGATQKSRRRLDQGSLTEKEGSILELTNSD